MDRIFGYAAHNNACRTPAHLLLDFIPVPGKMHLSRERFSAQSRAPPAYCSKKRTIEDFAVSKMGAMRDAREYSEDGWIAER